MNFNVWNGMEMKPAKIRLWNGTAFVPDKPFTPYRLFLNGEEGVIVDFGDLDALFQDTAGTQPATDLVHPIKNALDQSGNGNDATSTTAWLLRRDAIYSAQRDQAGTFKVTLPDLGSDATVAYVDEQNGVTILTGQVISGGYSLPTSARLGAAVIVDRPLPPSETAFIKKWLNIRRPGNWIFGLGIWDDGGVWEDDAKWQTAA